MPVIQTSSTSMRYMTRAVGSVEDFPAIRITEFRDDSAGSGRGLKSLHGFDQAGDEQCGLVCGIACDVLRDPIRVVDRGGRPDYASHFLRRRLA